MPSASASASRTAGSASRRTTSTARGARTTYDASERPSRPAAGSATARRPAARVRWDRLARVVMMCVLGVLLYLYASAGTSILTTWRSSVHHRAQLSTLTSQNRRLQAQRAVLQRSSTIVDEARRLGMVRPGERAYVVRNLPAN